MNTVLVCDPISEDALKILKNSNVNFRYEPDISPDELLSKVGTCEALIVRSRTKVTAKVLADAPKLRVIGRAGVGIDNIDVEGAKNRGIKIINTPEALTNAVAEFTLALMLELSRKIHLADSSMREGKWAKSSLHGIELRGRTYGTIGVGRIGQRVVELATAFGMRILANDIIPIPEGFVQKYNVHLCSRQQVFEDSDFVDLHVPLTSETTNLVNYDATKKMKKTSFLINTSRGRVVNEMDLLRALNEGLIEGAALDVFEQEPPTERELLRNPKLIITPHIAGQTDESQAKAGIVIAKEVLRFLGYGTQF